MQHVTHYRGRALAKPYYKQEVSLALPDGTVRRREVRGKSEAEVRRRVRELRARVAADAMLPDERTTVAEALERYLLTRTGRTRESSRAVYSVWQRHIVARLGGVRLARLTAGQVEAFQAALVTEAGMQPVSAGHTLTLLRAALNYAVRAGHLPRNPALGIEPLDVTPHTPVILTAAQCQQLLAAAQGSAEEALWALGLLAGLRLGEALALNWADVDLATGVLTVRASLSPRRLLGPTKSGQTRVVPLMPRLRAVLERHREAQAGEHWPEGDWLFRSGDGHARQRTTVRNHWLAFLRAAGLPAMRYHDLRHTFVSRLLASGESLPRVSRLVGHSSTGITDRIYTHLSVDDLREVPLALERLLQEEEL